VVVFSISDLIASAMRNLGSGGTTREVSGCAGVSPYVENGERRGVIALCEDIT
jgi:hypothetical protein